MSINILTFNRKNIILPIIFSLGLHYLFNPAESIGTPIVAKLVRIISGLIVLTTIFIIFNPSKKIVRLAVPFALICLWFSLFNFPGNILPLFTLFLFMGSGLLISAYLFYESQDLVISRSLDFLLVFWVLSLVVQLLVYLATSEVYDFHRWLHPWSEGRVHDVGMFIRFTGVLIEPGTYANWMFGLIILRGVSNDKLFDRLSVVSMISILVTLSAWGVVTVGVYLIAYTWQRIIFNEKLSLFEIIILISIILISFAVFYDYYSEELDNVIQYLDSRSELIDESGAAKVQAYDGFSRILPSIFIFGESIDYDFCNGCLSPQDAGIFVNIAVRGGIVFTLTMFFVIGKCIYHKYGVVACVCVVPLAFTKYFYFEPIFWSIFGFCLLDFFEYKKRFML